LSVLGHFLSDFVHFSGFKGKKNRKNDVFFHIHDRPGTDERQNPVFDREIAVFESIFDIFEAILV
jgi:hypothetical protein